MLTILLKATRHLYHKPDQPHPKMMHLKINLYVGNEYLLKKCLNALRYLL